MVRPVGWCSGEVGALTREDYVKFALDVRRLRLLVVVVLALAVVTPSVAAMFREDLSPVTVLLRLVLALVVVGLLVWAISALLLHYARVQMAERERAAQRAHEGAQS